MIVDLSPTEDRDLRRACLELALKTSEDPVATAKRFYTFIVIERAEGRLREIVKEETARDASRIDRLDLTVRNLVNRALQTTAADG